MQSPEESAIDEDNEVSDVIQSSEESAKEEDDDVIFIPMPPQEPIILEDDEDTPADTNQNKGTSSYTGAACEMTRPGLTNKARPSEVSSEEPSTAAYTGEVMNTVTVGPRIRWGSIRVWPKEDPTIIEDSETKAAAVSTTTNATSNDAGNTADPTAAEINATLDGKGIYANSTRAQNSSATDDLSTTAARIVVGYAISCACSSGTETTAASAMTSAALNRPINSTETAVAQTNTASAMTCPAFNRAGNSAGSAITSETFNRPGNSALSTVYLVSANKVNVVIPKEPQIITKQD